MRISRTNEHHRRRRVNAPKSLQGGRECFHGSAFVLFDRPRTAGSTRNRLGFQVLVEERATIFTAVASAAWLAIDRRSVCWPTFRSIPMSN